jgi:hypothetical protein
MIIIFNLIGAGILILALGVGAGVGYLFGAKTEAPTMLVGGLLALVLDLIYRMDRGEGSLLHPRRGGHVFFIPAWAIGLVLFMTGALYLVLPENGRELSREYRQKLLRPGEQPRAEPGGRYLTVSAQPQETRPVLKLTMMSGTGQRCLATINGEIFAPGETHHVKVAQGEVTVTCVEMRERSVMAKITGQPHPVELKFGEPLVLQATH